MKKVKKQHIQHTVLDEKTKSFFNTIATVSLSLQEKTRMRHNLMSYIELPSLKVLEEKKMQTKAHVIWNYFTHPLVSVYVPVLSIVILTFLGSSHAASNALPGDVLYPMKVNINEPAESLFSLGSEAIAQTHILHAVERLKEIEQLSAKGTLDSVTEAKAVASFQEEADSVSVHIENLSKQGDLAAAALVSSDFESSLASHSTILTALSNQANQAQAKVSIAATQPVQTSEAKSKGSVTLARIEGDGEAKGEDSATSTTQAKIASQADTASSNATTSEKISIPTTSDTEPALDSASSTQVSQVSQAKTTESQLLSKLTELVNDHLSSTTQSRKNTEMQIVSENSEAVKASATKARKDAESAVIGAEKLSVENAVNVSSTTLAKVKEEIATSREIIGVGNDKFTAGNFGEAFTLYSKARRRILEVSATLTSETKVNSISKTTITVDLSRVGTEDAATTTPKSVK